MPADNTTTFGDDADAKASSWSAFSGYLATLFEPGDVIEIRCLGPDRQVQHYWETLDTLAGIHDALCELNDTGTNIYFGINPRNATGGTKATDVSIARSVCIDIDGGVDTEQLLDRLRAAGLPEPSVAIASGGGVQGVWRLSEKIPVERWQAIQRGIIGAVDGADTTIADPPRVMRLPGFRNRKKRYVPDFPMATTTHFTGAKHDPDVFPEGEVYRLDFVGGADPEKLNIDTTGILPAVAVAFLDHGTLLPAENNAVPSRRQTAFRVAIEMAAAGFSQDDAVERISQRLRALGLDEDDVLDFVGRQIPNAFKEPRSPTIDRDKLPTTIPSELPAEPTVEVLAHDKQRVKVIARRGPFTAVDVIDPTKANSRAKFINQAVKQLGDDTDTTVIDTRLKDIATGDVQPTPAADTMVDHAEFLDVSALIRPERFTVRAGEEWATGFTVPKFRRGDDGLEGVWMAYLGRSDGTRDFIPLPDSIEVAGDRYYVHPQIGKPAVERLWEPSAGVVEGWLRDGAEVMQPDQLFGALVESLATFIELPEEPTDGFLKVMALWTVLTYSADQWPVVPFLAVNGPKGSGKSRIFHCLNALVYRAHAVINPSAASLFRHLHARGGTVLVDESENLEDADPSNALMPTLLSSNTQGACVARCEGEDNTPVTFQTFGPKAFFSIAEPIDTLLDRAIHIRMFRAPPGNAKTALHPGDQRHRHMWQRLRDALFTFSMQRAGELSQLRDICRVCPDDMFPRSRETWGPVLQLADLFERLGVPGLLAELQTFATEKTRASQDVTVDETHEAVLRALVSVVTDGIHATSGAILKRAYAEGLDPSLKLTDRSVCKMLRSYGFTQHRTKTARLWVVSPQRMAAIARNYGINLGEEKEEGRGTCEIASPVSPVSPAPPKNSVSPEKNGDFAGDTLSSEECHPVGQGDTLRADRAKGDTLREKECHPKKRKKRLENSVSAGKGDTGDTNDALLEAPQPPTYSADTVSGEVEL